MCLVIIIMVQSDQYLHTEVTISMANERLGTQAEVVFHIEEGAFYDCVMPGEETNQTNIPTRLVY